jgi:hypothetical protein
MKPTPAEIEGIVGRLTEAQREGLTGAWRTPAGRMAVSERCEGASLNALEIAGLVDGALCLTPLGLAVHHHLIEGSKK